MRVLSFDPGSERAGWGVIDKFHAPAHVDSGVVYTWRGDKDYQPYRLGLIEFHVKQTHRFIELYRPDLIATETVPPNGAASGGSIRLHLAEVMITTVQTVAVIYNIPIQQISARTVQSRIGKTKKRSKPKVRDGVIKLLPALESKRHLWIGKDAVYEEPDALGVGLVALGYHN